MGRGIRCTAHVHHRPVPEEHHHVQPMARGGRTDPDNMRYLCANGHSDVHYFLDLIERNAKTLIGTAVGIYTPVDLIPWVDARTYAPKVRDTAVDGWERYGEAFLRGEFRRHAALWNSAGQPRPEWHARIGVVRGGTVQPVPFTLAGDDVDYLLSLVQL